MRFFFTLAQTNKKTMKKILLAIPIFIMSCTVNKPQSEVDNGTEKISYKVDQNNVASLLKTLASDDFEGRESGSKGIEKAAFFLEKFLKNNNIKPYFDTYRDRLTNFDKPTYNIVGYLQGNDSILKKEFIILGAHYDHIGIAKSGADRIYNGANDDASGVTAVAEIGKYFSQFKTNKRSILMVFFSGEEKGLLGSEDLAIRLKAKNFNLYTMINFEMIGVPMKRAFTAYLTGFNKSNMASKMNEYANNKKLIGYFPQEVQNQLFSRSDNYSFYNQFNVPSQTICTFDFQNFQYYHKVKDEFSAMNIPHMTSLIENMLPVITKVANSSSKEIKLN
jgi:hypothetical protein